ncbi:MAG: TlpA family protein disulfide reductase, partial [Cyclobacteriaceae bacterium]|nr:TlpA family protein disulfide reductase [Cyclobacteriaceae bacterium]
MFRIFFFAIVIAMSTMQACTQKPEILGTWRATLEMQNQTVPFTFTVYTQGENLQAQLHNGSENITLTEVNWREDTLVMHLHIFDAALEATVDGNNMKGNFVRYYDATNPIPFEAQKSITHRFVPATQQADEDFSGKYTVTFSNEKDTTDAVGIFEQKGNIVTGTFLTTTGDYRYLEGNVVNKELFLSAFDGNHAFLFTAIKKNDSLQGHFYSGKSYHQNWIGIKNDKAELPAASSLTFLKPGFETISFSFPNTDSTLVSPQDEKYKNKVLVLQIFGTWCPNCMDETRFLADWYRENANRGVEILGLAFERKEDFNYAKERVLKMKEKLSVPYSFVIAGTNDKAKASEALPMLNKVLAFPTTIFIGKDGKVKKIHTGFSGPGTGIY